MRLNQSILKISFIIKILRLSVLYIVVEVNCFAYHIVGTLQRESASLIEKYKLASVKNKMLVMLINVNKLHVGLKCITLF